MLAISPDFTYNAEDTFEQMLHSPNEYLKNDFKTFLSTFLAEIKHDDNFISNIKNLSEEDLYSSYKGLKKLNSLFDRLHQSYYDKQYLQDEELKILLGSVGNQLHKLENVSHKYYTKHLPIEKTPDYIKSGLSQYSQETLSKKLSQ